MTTIGRHWPKSAPRGDYAATCDLCGFRYRRSQLVDMPGGTLRCMTDCAKERDAYTLDQANAAQNVTIRTVPIGGDGAHGSFDVDEI